METAAALVTKTRSSQLRLIVRVARFVAPGLLTILLGWGTVQFTQGRNAQRLDNVEEGLKHTLTREEFKTWADDQRETLRSTNQKADKLVTREEFRLFADQTREEFRELKQDLRSMKK